MLKVLRDWLFRSHDQKGMATNDSKLRLFIVSHLRTSTGYSDQKQDTKPRSIME